MALDQHAANLVDITVKTFNGDATSISPFDGISLIDSWITTLRDEKQNTISVANGLTELKAELQSGNPNGWQIRGILENLVNQVKQTANSADTDVKTKLTPLIDALDGFSHQLGGSSKPANTGGDAPMTSTVGGESTTSGAGVSSLNDSTGSDARNTGGATGDDYSPESGTRSSGVSSGPLPNHSSTDESETDTGTSSGRSQY